MTTREAAHDDTTTVNASSLWDTPGWAQMTRWPAHSVPAVIQYFDYAAHAVYLAYNSARALDPANRWDPDGLLEGRIAKLAAGYGHRAEAGPAAALHVGKLILAGRLGAEWVRANDAAQSDPTLNTLLSDMITSVWRAAPQPVNKKGSAVHTAGALHRHVRALGYDREPLIGPVITELRLYASAPRLGAHGRVARALTRHSLARHHHSDEQHVLGRVLIDLLPPPRGATATGSGQSEV